VSTGNDLLAHRHLVGGGCGRRSDDREDVPRSTAVRVSFTDRRAGRRSTGGSSAGLRRCYCSSDTAPVRVPYATNVALRR
jgi:hypothetical protein